MDWKAVSCRQFTAELSALKFDGLQDLGGKTRNIGSIALRIQPIERRSNVARQLDEWAIAVIQVRRQDVDVDDLTRILAIPFLRRIFDGIVADRDDEIG